MKIYYGELITARFEYTFRSVADSEEKACQLLWDKYKAEQEEDYTLLKYNSFEEFCDDITIIEMELNNGYVEY